MEEPVFVFDLLLELLGLLLHHPAFDSLLLFDLARLLLGSELLYQQLFVLFALSIALPMPLDHNSRPVIERVSLIEHVDDLPVACFET